jgi:hypothetical protein
VAETKHKPKGETMEIKTGTIIQWVEGENFEMQDYYAISANFGFGRDEVIGLDCGVDIGEPADWDVLDDNDCLDIGGSGQTVELVAADRVPECNMRHLSYPPIPIVKREPAIIGMYVIEAKSGSVGIIAESNSHPDDGGHNYYFVDLETGHAHRLDLQSRVYTIIDRLFWGKQ